MDDKVFDGLNMLLADDGYLLLNDTSERSITHKLAEHIQFFMQDWNVDCEYNKHGKNIKRLGLSASELLGAMKDLIAKALREEKIQQKDADWAISSIESHEDLIDIYGEKVPRTVAESLYAQITEKAQGTDFEEFGGVLKIVVTRMKDRRGSIQDVSIFPDIIVHHRGTEDNLIVIETKKSSEPRNERWLWDYVKLIAMMHLTGLYAYKYGYFINLPVGADFTEHASFKFKDGFNGFAVVTSK